MRKDRGGVKSFLFLVLRWACPVWPLYGCLALGHLGAIFGARAVAGRQLLWLGAWVVGRALPSRPGSGQGRGRGGSLGVGSIGGGVRLGSVGGRRPPPAHTARRPSGSWRGVQAWLLSGAHPGSLLSCPVAVPLPPCCGRGCSAFAGCTLVWSSGSPFSRFGRPGPHFSPPCSEGGWELPQNVGRVCR